jgi:excisionase family DNA binding protein
MSQSPEQLFTEKLLYSRNDAARALSISVRKLEELIRSGQLQVVRIGRRVLISQESLRRIAG